MSKSLYLLVFCLLFGFCSTPGKLANKAFHHALLGETEPTIYNRIGTPSRIVAETDGGKVFIYEFTSIERFPSLSNNPEAINLATFTTKSGLAYDIPYYSRSKNPKNTIYQENVSSLLLFIDNHGYCTRIDHNLPKEKLDYFYNRLKAYIPEK